jgi:hypothetical protein
MKVYERNGTKFMYPEDMTRILDYLHERGKVLVEDSVIEDLYCGFSDDIYCASWMEVTDERLAEFEEWLCKVEV